MAMVLPIIIQAEAQLNQHSNPHTHTLDTRVNRTLQLPTQTTQWKGSFYHAIFELTSVV